jgi:cytochrome c biogenesis protein CcdA
MKKIFVFFLISCCFFFSNTKFVFSQDSNANKEITVFFTSNINGQFNNCGCPGKIKGGLPRLANLYRKSKTNSSLLLDSGDILPPKTDLLKAKFLLEAIKHINYDAIGVGDQELLNLNVNNLDKKSQLSFLKKTSPFISSIAINNKNAFLPYKIINKNNVKILVFSLISKNEIDLLPKNLKEKIKAPESHKRFVEDIINKYKNETDLIIALSHLSNNKNFELARKFPLINVIIAGHDQEKNTDINKIGNTLIVQAGNKAKYLGKLDISLFSGQIKDYSYNLLPIDDSVVPDKSTAIIRTKYFNEIKKDIATNTDFLQNDVIYVFYKDNCNYCDKLINHIIPSAFSTTGKYYPMIAKQLDNTKNFKQFFLVKGNTTALPLILLSGQTLAGEKEINENNLRLLLNQKLSQKYIRKIKREKPKNILKVTPIVLAALIDGINPCAFGALIILFAYLSIRRKKKLDFVLSVVFYTLAVFITYLLIGLGLFNFLSRLMYFNWIQISIRYFTALIAFIFAFVSLYDAYCIYKGNNKNILLQLPNYLKDKIRVSIRENTKSGKVILSSIILGFLVSIFEFNCTGQVYLPTIVYLIKTTNSLHGYLWLVFYNIIFILPLIICALLIYFGLTHQKLVKQLEKSFLWLKLGLAIAFFTLGFGFLF